jgi:alpha-mannosidase
VNTFPQKRFVDISNGNIGLGVLNRGLPEYEILQEGPGVSAGQMAVAVTLLRCVEWLSRDDLSTRHGHAGPMEYTPEAQCLGEHVFHYALVPHGGDWQEDEAHVLREAQAFNLPVRAALGTVAQTPVHERQDGQPPAQLLPARASLLQVEPPALVVSAIKRSNTGEGLVVRLYNPLTHAVEATLYPGLALHKAFVANLQEEVQEQLLWSGESEPLHVGMRAGEITTLLFA